MPKYEVEFREDMGGETLQPPRDVLCRMFRAFVWEGSEVIAEASVWEYPALRILQRIEIKGDRSRGPAAALIAACRGRWPGLEINKELRAATDKLLKDPPVEWTTWPLRTQKTLRLDKNEAMTNPLAREIVEVAKELMDDGKLEEVVNLGLELGYETVGVNTSKLKRFVKVLKDLNI